MERKQISPETIYDIYVRAHDLHYPFEQINRDTKVSASDVIYKRFINCINGTKVSKRQNYRMALDIFRKEEKRKIKEGQEDIEKMKREIPPIAEGKTPSIFSFIFNGISEGVNAFVDARVDAKIGKVSEEYRRLAEENKQIRELLEEAKVKNWGATLQKKQEGETV